MNGYDPEHFIDDETVRRVITVIGMVKGLALCAICVYILFSPMWERMRETKDEVILFSVHGFRILLILFIIIGAVMFLRHLLSLIIQLGGMDEDGFGRKYIVIMGVMESNTGRLVQAVMGIIFTVFSIFAIKDGATMLTEGSDETVLYIISGVFCLAGTGMFVSAIIGVVKSIREFLS